MYESHIDYAFHALAIEEKRGPFEPALWQCPKGKNVDSEKVQQVWFTGVHSNVGGSYEDAGLSDIALDWMIKRVEKATDLAFNEEYRKQHIKPDHQGTEKGHKYVNEMIHRSAIDRFGKEMLVQQNKKTPSRQPYIPENLAKAKDKLPIVEYDGSICE